MTEKTFKIKSAAPWTKVRSLTADTEGPVRILGLVIESMPGNAIVQDLLDDIDKAKSVRVIVEGELIPEHKYILIGNVTEKKDDSGKSLLLNATLAHDVTKLDVRRFRDALDLEERVHSHLVK